MDIAENLDAKVQGALARLDAREDPPPPKLPEPLAEGEAPAAPTVLFQASMRIVQKGNAVEFQLVDGQGRPSGPDGLATVMIQCARFIARNQTFAPVMQKAATRVLEAAHECERLAEVRAAAHMAALTPKGNG